MCRLRYFRSLLFASSIVCLVVAVAFTNPFFPPAYPASRLDFSREDFSNTRCVKPITLAHIMPVSHLGLTVSHIPTATAFYLSALQPLGYRYHGSRGDSIGLGVHEADFFLTQEPQGYHLAPTHIAFSAESRSTVRDCYAAALNAGAYPSGPPSYRQDDCKCFNAAVEDFDGNTVEFIWRDSNPVGYGGAAKDDYGRARSMSSYARPVATTTQTSQALDTKSLASSPRLGIQRSSTDPVGNLASNSIFGVVLGAAAAGAAVGLAMLRSERDSDRDDARYSSQSRPQGRSSSRHVEGTTRRSASVADGERSCNRAGLTSSRTTDYPPNDFVVRRIDAKPYRDDENISYTRHTFTRHSQGQSRAVEAIKYGPSRSSTRRSFTMPVETPEDHITVHSRRSSVPHSKTRRDSVVSAAASRSRRASDEERRSSTSQASTVRPIKKDSAYYAMAAAAVPLPPSMVSSRASTARPSRSSRFDAYYLPAEDPEESDGLGDTATIVPDDSISCINLPNSRKHRSSSKRGSRAERNGSVMTIPSRSAREERARTRNAYSHA